MGGIDVQIYVLRSHIEVSAQAAGLPWDTYDADFLLGAIFAWLGDHDAIITWEGIHSLSALSDASVAPSIEEAAE